MNTSWSSLIEENLSDEDKISLSLLKKGVLVLKKYKKTNSGGNPTKGNYEFCRKLLLMELASTAKYAFTNQDDEEAPFILAYVFWWADRLIPEGITFTDSFRKEFLNEAMFKFGYAPWYHKENVEKCLVKEVMPIWSKAIHLNLPKPNYCSAAEHAEQLTCEREANAMSLAKKHSELP